MAPTARRITKTCKNNPEDDGDLQHCEDQLKLASLLDPSVIEQRNQDGGSDGDELSVGHGKGMIDYALREKSKHRKRPENAHQAGGYGGNGCGFRDQEPGPRVEESRQRPVGIANVYVLAAGL